MEYGVYNSLLTAIEISAYQTIIKVSTGELRFEGLKEWLRNNGKRMG